MPFAFFLLFAPLIAWYESLSPSCWLLDPDWPPNSCQSNMFSQNLLQANLFAIFLVFNFFRGISNIFGQTENGLCLSHMPSNAFRFHLFHHPHVFLNLTLTNFNPPHLDGFLAYVVTFFETFFCPRYVFNPLFNLDSKWIPRSLAYLYGLCFS